MSPWRWKCSELLESSVIGVSPSLLVMSDDNCKGCMDLDFKVTFFLQWKVIF